MVINDAKKKINSLHNKLHDWACNSLSITTCDQQVQAIKFTISQLCSFHFLHNKVSLIRFLLVLLDICYTSTVPAKGNNTHFDDNLRHSLFEALQ